MSAHLNESQELKEKVFDKNIEMVTTSNTYVSPEKSRNLQPFVTAWSKFCFYLCLRRATVTPCLLRWSILLEDWQSKSLGLVNNFYEKLRGFAGRMESSRKHCMLIAILVAF